MAPPSGSKRKRQEDTPNRPSPHRPENLNLAQQNQHQSARGRNNGRRQSRNRGQSPNSAPNGSAAPATPVRASPRNAQPAATPAAEPSRPSTPVQKNTTPAPPPQDVAPPAPPAFYVYDYLTEDVVAQWKESGRQAMLEIANRGDFMATSIAMQELTRAGLDRKIEATEAGAVIKDMIAQQKEGEDLGYHFLNLISLLDDADTKNPALGRIVTATEIDPDEIREVLDVSLLISLGLVRSTFDRMRARKTTNQLYRQANFNLLREETEGYAKLLTDYYNAATDAVTSDDPEMAKEAYSKIMALVGAFDLDPGRVLDITLDISAALLVKSFRFFVKFYRRSAWWPEKAVLDDVKFEDQGFGALPTWGVPGAGKWATSEADRAELADLRYGRDLAFWERVRKVGTDAFFELGARKIIDIDSARPLLETVVQPQHDVKGKEVNEDQRKRINESRKYMRETGTLPPPGNPEAAQLLGFKLRFYASHARDASDNLPDNLIYLAALLIKIGFISLRDLYPHLYPLDEDMPAEIDRLKEAKAEKERKERPGGGMNALSAAAALSDDSPAVVRNLRADAGRSGGNSPKPEKQDAEVQEELPRPTNQKLLLLKALLAIGDLPSALFILGKFPALADLDTSLPPYLHRIANKMLSKVANDTKPMSSRAGVQDTKQEISDTVPSADGSFSTAARPEKRHRRWLGLEQPDQGDGVCQVHYYQDWDDNIPVCQTVEDVVLLCKTFLGFLGFKIGQNELLYTTLLRIAKKSLTDDFSDENRARWLDLMKNLLVPALSLTTHNPGIAEDVWGLLNMFPINTRYDIYAGWFTGSLTREPDMMVALARNTAEARDVLRRITNESGKTQARALSKVSIASPGVVINVFIKQLENYSNMIPGLVESVRYFSLFAFDVLSWHLINSLAGQQRARLQEDGMLTSRWLQALSLFIATLFTRYPVVNASPILQYLAFELRNGDTTNLTVVDAILSEMAGIKSDMNFNETQMVGMTGGELLQAQMLQQLSDLRHTKKTSAKRLIKSLSEPGLIGQILISLAQERQMFAFRESAKEMPLKVLGSSLDTIQQHFAQYLDVLLTNMSPADFEAAVPDVVSLIGDFHLEPGTAFAICRTGILHRMAESDVTRKAEKLAAAAALAAKKKEGNESLTLDDATMKDVEAAMEENDKQVEADTLPSQDDQGAAAVKAEDATKGEASAPEEDAQMTDVIDSGQTREGPVPTPTPQPSAHAATDGDANPWHPVLEPIMKRMSEVDPELASRVSVPFFVTFWTLSPQDAFMPIEIYTTEIEKLQAQARHIGSERTDNSPAALKERERKKTAIIQSTDKLRAEMNQRIHGYSQVKMWLNTQKKHWFPALANGGDSKTRHLALLQDCFLPRAMVSGIDAHYCLQIIKVMHNNATPGFILSHLLGQLFQKQILSAIITQCTAKEAENFGCFLKEILMLLASWHAKEETYTKEALGSQGQLHGFVKTVDPGSVSWDFQKFRQILSNWHGELMHAFKNCLNSGEYMQIRNSIIVLRGVVTVYPAMSYQGNQLSDVLWSMAEKEDRQDLKLTAKALHGMLKSRDAKWVIPQNFRLNDNGKDGPAGASRATSARPDTPQPRSATPKLNAGATDFKPSTSKLANGDVGKASGAEDGEIEDEKTGANKQDVKMEDAPPARRAADANATDRPTRPAQFDATRNTSRADRRGESKPSTPGPVGNARQAPTANGSARNDIQPPSRAGHSASQRPESGLPSKPPPSAAGGRGPRGGRDDDQFGRLGRPEDARVSRERSPGGHRSRARTPEKDPRDQYGPQRPHRDPRGGPVDSRYARDEPRSTSRREPLGPQQMPDTLQPREETRSTNRREPLGPQQMPTSSSSREEPRRREPLGPQRMPESHTPSDNRNRAMGPPSGQSPHPDRFLHARTDNAPSGQHHDSRPSPSVGPSSQAPQTNIEPAINPARAALIDGPVRGDRERGRDRDARPEERGTPGAARPDSRANGRNESFEPTREHDTPTGPRASRGGRESINEPPPRARPSESSYGRLNAPGQATEAPSGPRAALNGPPNRGGRNFTAPANARNETAASSPGPARAPREPSGRQEQTQHVDRQTVASKPSTLATENGPPGGMHPSRMSRVADNAPPPIQTNTAPNGGARGVASPTGPPPSGPRSNRPPAGTPTGPSPASAIPSGPAAAGPERKRGDRQRANINATLQGAGNGGPAGTGSNTQFRGAAGGPRSASYTAAPPAAASSTPPVDPSSRRDGPPNKPEGRGDLFAGRSGEEREPRPRRYEEERGEPRQRGSRHQSRERRTEAETPRRNAAQGPEDGRHSTRGDDRHTRDDRSGRDGGREVRDRRGAREEEQQQQPRRPLPDAQGPFSNDHAPPPPGPPPGNPPGWERGPSRRDDASFDGRRGGGRGAEYRGERRGDDRNGGGRASDLTQGPEGRKRRHEEGPSSGFGDPAKRRRSGR